MDLSGLIPENNSSIFNQETNIIMYADEFGTLRYAKSYPEKKQTKHSPVIFNSEVSISDKMLFPSGMPDGLFNYAGSISDLESKDFIHSYYLSKHFTIQTYNLSPTTNLKDIYPIANPDKFGIFVVDENGNQYIDNDGKNKYSICLQRYDQIIQPSNNEFFYRILVFLPDADPVGLNLVYNKFETTVDGLPTNQFFGYKEYINAVPYYDYVVEESEVVDPLSEEKLIYSTQLVSQKENQILKHKVDKPGWKTFVPRKAIQDPRTFQSFNWRLITKINYNYSFERNIYSDQERPALNAAVIDTSVNGNFRYPYIFHNIENYILNLQNIRIENPASNTNDKTSAEYWRVSLDNDNIFDFEYDILYWHPIQRITADQYEKISELIERGTSVFIDCSSIAFNDNNGLSTYFNIPYAIKSIQSGFIKIKSQYKNQENLQNQWNISDFEEKDSVKKYGIYGSRKTLIKEKTKPINAFDTSANWGEAKRNGAVYLENPLLSIPENPTNKTENNIILFEQKRFASEGSNSFSLRVGTTYFSATQISHLLNDKWTGENIYSKEANNGNNNSIVFANNQNISPEIEGALKLFYNIIANAFARKIISQKETTTESSIVWHLSPWTPSWTINGERRNGLITVLTKHEQKIYNFSDKKETAEDSTAGSSETYFCRQIVPSITEYLNTQIKNSSTNISLINKDYSNVEFYIETTNANVGFLNFAEAVDDEVFYQQEGSPYTLYKIIDPALKQIKSSSNMPIDAYAKINSIEFDQRQLNYPYMIVDNYEYLSEEDENSKFNRQDTKDTQQSLNYTFNLSTNYTYNDVKEKNSKYKVNWKIQFNTKLTGTGSFKDTVIRNKTVQINKSISEVEDNPVVINNSESPFYGFSYSSKIFSATDILSIDQNNTVNSYNNFHYTGDIDAQVNGNIYGKWDEHEVLFVNKNSSLSSSSLSKTVSTESLGQTPTRSVTQSGLKTDPETKYYSYYLPKIDPIYINKKPIQLESQGSGAVVEGKTLPGSNPLTNENGIAFSNIWEQYVCYDSSNTVVPFSALFTNWAISYGKLMSGTSYRTYLNEQTLGSLVAQFKKIYTKIYKINIPQKQIKTASAIKPEAIKRALNATKEKTKNETSTDKTVLALTESGYVRYIQYTLNKILGSTVFGKPVYPDYKLIPVDGIYGTITSGAVLKLQTVRSQSFLDGIVDSETKSVLAQYWINLKNTDKNRYEKEINEVFELGQTESDKKTNEQIAVYIRRATLYSNIAEVGNQEYRRISFTGIPGPEGKIQDYLIVKVPDNAEKLLSIKIKAGEWNVGVSNIWVCQKDLRNTNSLVVPFFNAEYPIKEVYRTLSPNGVLLTKADNSIAPGSPDPGYFKFAAPIKNVKYVIIKVTGFALRQDIYGPYAEGFSIKDISFQYTITEKEKIKVEKNIEELAGVGVGWIEGSTILDPDYDFAKLSFEKSIGELVKNKQKTTIKNIYFEDIYADFDDEDLDRNIHHPKYNGVSGDLYDLIKDKILIKSNLSVSRDIFPKWNLNFQLNTKITIDTNTFEIEDGYKLPEIQENYLTESSFEFDYLDKQKIFTIKGPNSAKFSNQITTNTINVNNYYIADADNINNRRLLPKTVSSTDGLVVLTNSLGQPVGFPDFSSLSVSSGNIQRNFGYINLIWSSPEQEPFGLHWGFYNVKRKTFYGTRLSYLDYINQAEYIYIGLIAYDADGDSSTENIIGTNNFIVLDNQLPNKLIAPLYSVKVSSKSKIGLYPPPENLSKFDSWFIQVGSGKFFKNIYIPKKNYTNFLSNHSEKNIRCLYDTTSFQSSYSTFLGRGYYDVIEEEPNIISNKEISLRHGSIALIKEQLAMKTIGSTYTNICRPTPWMFIYIKDSNNNWQKIDNNQIEYYNKHNGIVRFNKSIVPSNPKNIKVTYAVKNGNNIIRHIKGNEIPLNPFNWQGTEITKPIFIYVVPTKIEYNYNGTYVEDVDYSFDSEINWTTSYDIFDQNKNEYNPLALHIGTINVVGPNGFNQVSFSDLRVKGGGVSGETNTNIASIEDKAILSFADIRSGKGYIYPNGGYVIVKIPAEVKEYFTSVDEVYSIVRSNLTAGVSFDIQDLDGNDWRTI